MSNNRINEVVLDKKLPTILREKFKKYNLPRNQMPSWEFITANTPYSAYGLHLKCENLKGVTLHEHLQEQGFGMLESGYYATSNQETRESIQYYINSLTNRKKWSDNTIDTVKCAIKKATVVLKELGIDEELLSLARFETESERLTKIQHMINIFDEFYSQLEDGTMSNYTHYISKYYHTISNKYIIECNPANEALKEFDFIRKDSDPDPVTADQISVLWSTLNNLTECPYDRYDKEEWVLWLKILIVFIVAVGPRTCEIPQIDIRNQIKFGEDPHVTFHERKNLNRYEGPVNVPIMFGEDFLEKAIQYLTEIDTGGVLFPSRQSESGCRVGSTLNNWLRRLCKLSSIDFAGNYPTIQNFRQSWKTRYREAIHENRKYLKKLADEDGKKDPKSDRDDYIDQEFQRQVMRDLGREHFDDLFDINVVPNVIKQTLDGNLSLDDQTVLTDFSHS